MTNKEYYRIRERLNQLQPFFEEYCKLMNKIHNPDQALIGMIFKFNDIAWFDIEKDIYIKLSELTHGKK